MKASQLYIQLEKDFILPGISDDWAQETKPVAEFLTENFQTRSMGLVCDFTTEINKVYTAVFPSNKVMQKNLDDGAEEAMLFVHHPATWDIRKTPNVFQPMDRNLLQQYKERKIAIYNLHAPLDNFGPYSTSVNFAKALGIEPVKPFAPYLGGLAAVFGKTKLITIQDLKKEFETVVSHKVSLYNYGDNEIKNGMVAVAAGGGLDETIEDIAQNNVNVLITGIAAKTDHSKKAHEFAEKHHINILGGTHYSTEKFACIAMINYFKKLGLPSEFIEDEPVLEDM